MQDDLPSEPAWVHPPNQLQDEAVEADSRGPFGSHQDEDLREL